MAKPIKIGTRVKVTGPPSNNTVYGKVTKFKFDDNYEIVEYKVVFEDYSYGTSCWYPIHQVEKA